MEFTEPLISEVTTTENYETERNKPMPNKLHSHLQFQIGFQLKANYDDQFSFYPELSLDTNPGSTPDLCIYPKEKKIVKREVTARESVMPLTTIEIISPSQSFDAMTNKIRDIYFEKGVKSAWLVLPSINAVHVFIPNQKSLYFDGGVLEDPTTGIRIDLDKIFADVV